MSTEHKRPLAAFVVVALMGMLVLAGAARSEAVLGMLRDTATLVVAGSAVAPEVAPDDGAGALPDDAGPGVRSRHVVGPVLRRSAAPRHHQRRPGRGAAPGAVPATASHPLPPSHARAHDKGLSPDHVAGHAKGRGLAKGHDRDRATGHARAQAKSHAQAKGHTRGRGHVQGKGEGHTKDRHHH